jgi:hypothetical protein
VQTALTTDAGPARALQRAMRVLSHPYLLFLMVAAAVWLPQGFDIGPVNDGWVQMGRGLLRSDPSRIFGNLPIRVGMLLTPDSFVGIQCVLLVLVLLHAVFFYEIVRRLFPDRELIAVAAGLIGLFHSADRSYFWVGAMGLQFSLAAALASCVCAIQYLDHRRRRDLAVGVALQLLSILTYLAFVPLILGVPCGAYLLRRLAGARPPIWSLFKINLCLVVAAGVYLYLLHTGVGRNSKVVDVHFAAVLSGYGWALRHLFDSIPAVFAALQPLYLVPALLLAAIAYPAAARAAREHEPVRTMDTSERRYLAAAVAGLAALALLCYLPYSISTVRYSGARTLLACGMCAYTALAVVLLAWVEMRLHRRWLALSVMLLAGYTVLVGQRQREPWLDSYRAEERLLAGIAASVPHPYPGTVFLVYLHETAQADAIDGFYNRQLAFSTALANMYGDPTLTGGFVGFGDDAVSLDADGVTMRGFRGSEGRLQSYRSLVVVDYPADAPATVLGTAWLRQQAGTQAAAAAAYSPHFDTQPAAGAITCSMLESGMRPGYCR